MDFNEEVIKQWHPIKNGSLIINQFSKSSKQKVWWLCDKKCNEGCLHEWEATIGDRIIKNSGCPYCSGRNTCIHNSIVYKHPDITKQWHPTKNVGVKPEQFRESSGVKVWWLCDKQCSEGCLHEWESVISGRTRGNGCQFCSGKQLCIHESIVHTHPNLLNEWHPTKNIDIKPEQFRAGCNKKVWWLCDKKCSEGCLHEWEAVISSRIQRGNIKGRDCPFCCIPQQKKCSHNSIVYTNSNIALQFHPTKNGSLNVINIINGSHQKVWWLCEKQCKEGCKHEWEAVVRDRINDNNGCPYCSGRNTCIHDSIVDTHNNLIAEWHPSKNSNIKPEQFRAGSNQKVWWLCDKKCSEGCLHEWEAIIYSRTSREDGCPFCCNKNICIHNSIYTSYPNLVEEWHPTKNGSLKPEQFSFGSGEKIWWKCNINKSHEWLSRIADRTTANQGCPLCSGRKTEKKLYDELIKYYPLLKQQFKVEWCKNKNKLPYDFALEEDKIIIELDGLQHFYDIKYFKSNHKEQIIIDKYKMKCATENGFSVIRILQRDVWTNSYEWLIELKLQIEKIKQEKQIQIIYMCKNNEYEIFINSMF